MLRLILAKKYVRKIAIVFLPSVVPRSRFLGDTSVPLPQAQQVL